MSAVSDTEAIQELCKSAEAIRGQLARIIVGQEDTIEELLIALLAGGHCLLVGVPGLAKTLTISSLAKTLDLDFNRVQFTPDLMPADITGTEVIEEDKASGKRSFRFIPGPLFANVILADEVNRTPPKTQSALLEAMQEHQITVGGKRHPVPAPFFVLATQNPIDQEGTYPLPEAQLDRFMFSILMDYPSKDDELEIVLQTTSGQGANIETCLDGDRLFELASVVRRVAVTRDLALRATQAARLTRPENPETPEFVKANVRWGAGPRASQFIVLAAKARAALSGGPIVRREDIEAVAKPVLRHRIRLNFQAESEGMTTDDVIDSVLRELDRNVVDKANSGKLAKVLRS